MNFVTEKLQGLTRSKRKVDKKLAEQVKAQKPASMLEAVCQCSHPWRSHTGPLQQRKCSACRCKCYSHDSEAEARAVRAAAAKQALNKGLGWVGSLIWWTGMIKTDDIIPESQAEKSDRIRRELARDGGFSGIRHPKDLMH